MTPKAPAQNLSETLRAHHQATPTALRKLGPPALQGPPRLGTCPGILCQCPAPGGFITH